MGIFGCIGTMMVLFLVMCVKAVEATDPTDPVLVILFMFCGLGVGIFIMQLLSMIGDPVPYTCVVFLSGILFSVANKDNAGKNIYLWRVIRYHLYLLSFNFTIAGLLGDSISEWAQIDSELLLFIFLPPLVFGEAMGLNYFHACGGLLQSVVLAGDCALRICFFLSFLTNNGIYMTFIVHQ